jgi:hypothetical protein
MAKVSTLIEAGQRRSADDVQPGLVVLLLRPVAGMPWCWICVDEHTGNRIPLHVNNLGEELPPTD